MTYQIRRLWNGIAPVLSTNLVDAGLVDPQFNEALTVVAVAAFDVFNGRSSSTEQQFDGSGSRRRRRRQSAQANEASANLDDSLTNFKANNNFFEYQRNNGYKLAIPSIAHCVQVQHLEDEFFNASTHYLEATNATAISNQLANNSGEFSIDMWAAVQKGKGAYHELHVHEGCVVSGVYYSACPVGCAPLVLRKPSDDGREGISFRKDDDEILHPKEGDMILFPSWLEHGVPLAESTSQPRVSWPFNLNARLASVADPWDKIK